MSYPITISINEGLRTPAGSCQKTLTVDKKRYAYGFVPRTYPSVRHFLEAVGPSEGTNGPGFSFGVFDHGHRHHTDFQQSFGVGIDFDKITKLKSDEILWDKCEEWLPTLDQLLNSRVGSYVRAVYLSQSCPDDAGYVMGRAILTYERGLSFDEDKALGLHLIQMLREDFPNCDKESLKAKGFDGGIDAGAISDPCRWWAGIKHGRKPLFISEEVPPLPNPIIDSWVGQGQKSPFYYTSTSDVAADTLTLDPQTIKVFDVLFRQVIQPSAKNSYASVYRWLKTFVQQNRPHLDEAFAVWMERSPYRMNVIGGDPQGQIYHTKGMDFAYLGKIMKVISDDSPDWINQYYQLTGEYPHFCNAQDIDEEYFEEYTMRQHPGLARDALEALGL